MSQAAVIEQARSVKRYGWIPQLPDHRDIKFKVAEPTPLPDTVDLRPKFFPPYDQGQIGSCTANAIAAAFEYDLRQQSLVDFTPSRLFIYFNERLIEKTVDTDAGAMIRDGMKAIKVAGAPPESIWPYKVTKFAEKPPVNVYREGRNHKGIVYEALPQAEYPLRRVLADGLPFIFGFTVFASFESQAIAKSGMIPLPDKDEQDLGGHAVLAVGYIMLSGFLYFIVRNSWGVDWGDKGYFYIPASYVLNPDLASDFWVLRTVQSDNQPPTQ